MKTKNDSRIVNKELRDAFVGLVAKIEETWKSRGSFVDGRPALSTIQQTAEHVKFETELRNDKSISPWIDKIIATDGLPPRTLTVPQIVSDLIGDYPYYAVELVANPDSIYEQFEQTFHTSRVRLRALAPVYWMSLMSNDVKLDEKVEFRKLQIWEVDHYVVPSGFPKPLDLFRPSAIFDTEWTQPVRTLTNAQNFEWAPTFGNRAFNRFRFCLRLLGFRYFENPSLFIRSSMGVGLGFQNVLHTVNPLNASRVAEFSKMDASKLTKLWQSTEKIMGVDFPPWLQLALARLNTACSRPEPADALLDFTIAMESLLQYENAPEITYRLKSRAAVVIGLAQDERVAPGLAAFAEDTVKKAYDTRSSIVHGETGKYNDIEELIKINARVFDLIRVIATKLMCLRKSDKRYLLEFLVEGSMKSPLIRRYLDTSVTGSALLLAIADFF
jgi:hypothetical protein